jgi:GTP-binding protein
MKQLRNIAIIAHVDHGKTTLVDQMLRQSGVFRANQEVKDLIMDSGDLERERGITILAKNTAIQWGDTKINVVDTPGHADFGGEVERVLRMVDGVLLLVDAYDGPMAQTRFVLGKAFAEGLRPIVVINKVDRPNARPREVLDEVVSLFCDFDVADHQLDFAVVYASGREGWAARTLEDPRKDFRPLFEAILQHIPAPTGDPAATLQVSVAAIEYDSYVGRIAIGKVAQGTLRSGQTVGVSDRDGNLHRAVVEKIFVFEKFLREEVKEVRAGEICAVVGLEPVNINDTITDLQNPKPIPVPPVEQPTISAIFTINTSPMSGQEGTWVQSRKIRERLFHAQESDVALKVEETASADSYKVSGRGVLHLGILVEKMRREGYEFAVGKPEVIMRDGEEPIERLIIDLPEEYSNAVVSVVMKRRGEVVALTNKSGRVRQEYKIPSRGLIGLRTKLLAATRGEAVMQTALDSYAPFRGAIQGRINGVQISMENGKAIPFALFNLADRGPQFVRPGDPIYEGIIVGEHCKPGDIVVNPCKEKKLTNIRSAGADENIILSPPRTFSVEEALEYIEDDELVEFTPKSIRLRKRILSEGERRKRARAALAAEE